MPWQIQYIVLPCFTNELKNISKITHLNKNQTPLADVHAFWLSTRASVVNNLWSSLRSEFHVSGKGERMPSSAWKGWASGQDRNEEDQALGHVVDEVGMVVVL